MLFKFKIVISDKDSKILGMFGDCIKVRLKKKDDQEVLSEFKTFLANELVVKTDIIDVKDFNTRKKVLNVNLPDEAYEILMSFVE